MTHEAQYPDLLSPVVEGISARLATGPVSAEMHPGLAHHMLGSRDPAWMPGPLSRCDVHALLARRTSVRSLSASPVDVAAVGRAVDAAMAADAELWADEVAAGVDLELILIAWNVSGLGEGSYARACGGFRPVGPAPARTIREAVTLQHGLDSAPLLLLAVGNLLAACERHGDHGYRLLLARGAAACHTAHLTAIHEGLCGVIVAGFHQVVARAVVGQSMVRRHLLALAIGHQEA